MLPGRPRPERRLTLADINRALDRLGSHAFIPRTRLAPRPLRERLAALYARLLADRDDRVAPTAPMDADVVLEPVTVPSENVLPTTRRMTS